MMMVVLSCGVIVLMKRPRMLEEMFLSYVLQEIIKVGR